MEKEHGPAYTRTGNRIKCSRKAMEAYLKKNVVENWGPWIM